MLSPTQKLGIEFEKSNLQVIKDSGYSKYINFVNPVNNPWQWLTHQGKGVDMVLAIGSFMLYIEESFCSHYYRYHQRWWNLCRQVRFNQLPCDEHHKQIVLTNAEPNFVSISTGSIMVMSLTSLLALIRLLVALLTTNTKTYNTHIGMLMKALVCGRVDPWYDDYCLGYGYVLCWNG